MSKNEKVKTRSAKATAHAKTSATTTNQSPLPKKLNPIGCRRLASRVIESALVCDPVDTYFLKSEWYDFWASLAYGLKTDYCDGKEVVKHRGRVKRVGRPKGTPPNNKLVSAKERCSNR